MEDEIDYAPPQLLGPDELPVRDSRHDVADVDDDVPDLDAEDDDNDDDSGRQQQQQQRHSASAVLSQPDFIMEDSRTVLSQMARFMHEVGDADALTGRLVAGYEGSAQHCNILADWLVNFADESAEDVKAVIEGNLAERVTAAFDPAAVDESIIAEDPVAFLVWLTSLVQFREWRDLIYQLSQRHTSCAFLNWAIKEISERGFEEEMKYVPAACSKLPVFSRYLSTSVSKLLAEEFDHSLDRDLQQFLEMACYGEATYLLSQALLFNLAQAPPIAGRGHVVRRLSQELEKAALAQGRDVSRYSVQLCGAHNYPRATAAMQSMLSRRQLNPADMLCLYQLYKQQDPPPAALLRLPLFVQLLTDALFLPESPVNDEYLHTYVYLLACSAAARDDTSCQSSELDLTQAAIDRASGVCRSNKHVMQSVRDLIKALRYPVVAYGVLAFVEKALTDERGCDLSQVEQTTVYLILVDEVATNHLHLRPRILPMLCRLFEHAHPSLDELSQLEFKVRLVDRFVHLVFVGHVEPVLDYMNTCLTSKLTDMSVLRHFVLEVLDMVGPPYTESFVSRLRPLVENQDIYNAIERKEGRDSCDKFLKDCSRTLKAARS